MKERLLRKLCWSKASNTAHNIEVARSDAPVVMSGVCSIATYDDLGREWCIRSFMPSLVALKILTWLASDYLAVPDSAALNGMKALAGGVNSDILVVCGESSTASVGVMLGLNADELLQTD
jgi:hypothetical protein